MYEKEKNMSIQAVSFGKTLKTKNGNEYKKTHAGTITGAVLGLGITGTSLYKMNKNSKLKGELKRIIGQTYSKLKTNMPKEKAAKFAKLQTKTGVAIELKGELKRIIGQAYSKLKTNMPKEKAAKFAKLQTKTGVAIGLSTVFFTWFGLGALVNKFINRKIANATDNAVLKIKKETEEKSEK